MTSNHQNKRFLGGELKLMQRMEGGAEIVLTGIQTDSVHFVIALPF